LLEAAWSTASNKKSGSISAQTAVEEKSLQHCVPDKLELHKDFPALLFDFAPPGSGGQRTIRTSLLFPIEPDNAPHFGF
jgi:hypothetical protein